MKNIYKTIKQNARKYALPAIVAGNLLFGANGLSAQNYLPVSEKEKTERVAYLDSLSNKAKKTLNLAEKSFQSGISDHIYDIYERHSTIRLYEKADELYKKVNNLGRNINSKYKMALSKEQKEFMEELKHPSKLEKTLKRDGFDVNVPNWLYTNSPYLIFFAGVVTLFYFFLHPLGEK